ncbi:MAG TPA: NADH-quinone oxidoreductase subunit N [Bryobacteraceae bacterium]|nr:NADH-quinone oxidoreductase subunit N [Bryobacteraceae bacterium]
MPVNFLPTAADYVRFLPEMIMTLGGVLIMLFEPLLGEDSKRANLSALTLAAFTGALVSAFIAYGNPGTSFSNMLIVDGFATFFRVLVIGVGILTLFSSAQYLRQEHAESSEYYALLLFSVTGQCVMVTANELIMIFIGLEISSIATYILAGYLRDDKRNNEAALKYFLLGSFATAFLLYGIAWIYGTTGSTNLANIRVALLTPGSERNIVLAGTAAALMFVGFAFKVSAAPFQIWAPDVYQGAPVPVTLFMSAGPKAAAFAVFLRVFMTAFGPIATRWEPFVWASALLTMIIGNFAALMQTNIKRLLAYSSIAHAGYIMVAIAAHNQVGVAAVMFYLAAYALMNIGALAVITYFSRQDEKYLNVDDLAGLGWKEPMTAAMFSIFLLSFIGVPLTGGFFGKFYIFKAALDANLIWLAVLGLLNSAVAAYYYLRILVVMYMKEPSEATISLQPPTMGINATLWLTALGTVVLGVAPSLILNFATASSVLIK